MKVLIVNSYDEFGGAARAAYRLHRALIGEGLDSKMLVMTKSSEDCTVLGPTGFWDRLRYKVGLFLELLPLKIYKNRSALLFSPISSPFSGLAKRINDLNPDVVHLHWVAAGMLSIQDLNNIKAPIFWTMHDNWVFTGGCHVMLDCRRYKEECGRCPNLGSNASMDLSRLTYLRKKRVLQQRQKIKFIAPSNWMADQARSSSLLQGRDIICLPNLLDTDAFSSFDKRQARNLFRLPIDKPLIAFGAIKSTSDVNKGYANLVRALGELSLDYELVVFGSAGAEMEIPFAQKVNYIGHLHDDVSLRALYSAVDVMVVPSYQESFGQVATEAMACGTPVVAFGATGLLDIVDHKVNGYLARPFDHRDLARGIEWVLGHGNTLGLGEKARAKIVEAFDSRKVVLDYLMSYKACL